MVWSWSHTQAAYDDLQETIAAQSREWLEEVYAEWKSSPGGHFAEGARSFSIDLDDRMYQRALCAARYIDAGLLAERIYAWAERASNCTNGGWEAWCCPHGCGCHTLAWDAYKEEWRAELRGAIKDYLRPYRGVPFAISGREMRELREALEERVAFGDAPSDEDLAAVCGLEVAI